jgi:ElaB/YqjD/DUF883 family membrane-anchored ribosome-binding protein
MDNEPEVIRQNMQDQRTALTEKLDALETKVMGVANSVASSVESVKDGVTETVESVKETVENTVGAVKETVADTVDAARDLFNLSEHVKRRPWLVLGGAVGVGFLVGALLRRRGSEPIARRNRRDAPPAAHQGNGAHKEAEPGPADGLVDSVKEGLNHIKDVALGALFGTVEQVLARELPQAVESQVKTFFDDAMTKFRNAVTPEKSAESSASEQPRRQPERQETGFDPVTGRPVRPGSW